MMARVANVPRPPPSLVLAGLGVGVTTVLVLCGAGAGGSDWKGLCWPSAAAGAARASRQSRRATRVVMSSGYVGQQAREHEPVAHREALPVVVEVQEGVVAAGVLAGAGRPLAQLGVGVVAAPAAMPPVEAHEREVRGARRH